MPSLSEIGDGISLKGQGRAKTDFIKLDDGMHLAVYCISWPPSSFGLNLYIRQRRKPCPRLLIYGFMATVGFVRSRSTLISPQTGLPYPSLSISLSSEPFSQPSHPHPHPPPDPPQVQVYPPSTLKSAPVTYLLASLSKNVTGPIKSSGFPICPCGINEVHFSLRSGFSSNIFFVKAVNIYPGLIQLTLIPALAHSTAKLAAKCRTAALEALYGVCGCGMLTMEPDMEPMKTMDPGDCLSIKWRATAVAKR